MEKLSVIVPVYNTYPYLRQCLDSIINQTYENLEIIIVNDASPYIEDDEICKEYAQKDSRIIYIKHDENKGASEAKQTGINHATGMYITFIDSDDYLLNLNCYTRLLEEFKNEDVSLVVFDIAILNKNKIKKIGSKIKQKKFNISIESLPICSYSMCNKIYLTNQLKELDYNKARQNFYEDNLFWIEYASRNKHKAIYVEKKYYYYRTVESSLTNNNNTKNIKLWIEEICETTNKYNDEIISDKFLAEYIKNEIINYIYNRQNYFADLYNAIVNNEKIKNILIENMDNLLLYGIFINDKDIREKYINEIKIYEKFGFIHIYPVIEIKLMKIQREIKRIVKQIKGLLNI